MDRGDVQTLAEVVARLDSIPKADRYDVGPTVFAVRPWGPDSSAVVLKEDALEGVAPSMPEFAYLLEVSIALDVLQVWSSWRNGAAPSLADAIEAIIHYATHDAYLPVRA